MTLSAFKSHIDSESYDLSDDIFRSLIEISPQFVWLSRADGFITFANERWCEYTGLTLEQSLGLGWTNAIHPDYREKAIAVWQDVVTSGKVYEAEIPFRRHDGEYGWHLAKGVPVKDQSGKIERWVGIAVDITERKEAEEQLLLSNKRLEIAIEATALGIWDYNPVTHELEWSEMCKKYFGLPSDAETNFDIFLKGVHPDDRERVEHDVQQSLSNEENSGFDCEYRTIGIQDGVERWVKATGRAFFRRGRAVKFTGTIKDITEEKKNQHTLEESEMKFRQLANSIPQMVWMSDPQGNPFWYNDRFAEFSGLSVEEMKAGGRIRMHHPDYIEKVTAGQKKAWSEGNVWEDSFPLRSKEGVYHWFIARAFPVRDENGEITRWFGTTTDITEQRITEIALRESEQSWRVLAEAMPQLVWVTNADGVCEYLSKQWKDYTGIPEAALAGYEWMNVLHPADREKTSKVWKESVENHRIYSTEFRIRRNDGAYRWFKVRGVPVLDNESKITKWYGTCTDISDELKRELFTRSILQSSPDLVEVVDMEGNLISINQGGFLQMEDSSAGQKEKWQNFWHGDDFKKADDAIRDARKGRTTRFEGFCPLDKGTPKWWEVIVTPVNSLDEERTRILCISRDITERKEISDKLEGALAEARAERKRAEDANLAKTEFLANMSHEIRTPMNAVVGLANILSYSSPLTAKQKEAIETLQMSADALLALINDLLDITKIEAQTVDLESIPFSLNQIIDEVVTIQSVRVKEKGLKLTVNSGATKGVIFAGDPVRVRQIILNLCSNAVKFTEQGEVAIDVTREDQGAVQNIIIEVKDTGIGIDPEKIGVIFDKFVQADNSINRKYGGTGLGLAITKTLAQIMNGNIEVESKYQEGSTFKLTLPLKLADENSALPDSQGGEEAANEPSNKVLLVEDYAPNVLVATTLLEEYGYAYDVASSGEEAIQRIGANKYAAVLMDVQMHGMNGLEATGKIREMEAADNSKRLTIIGMTAHALAGDRERCINAGMDDYISKPFNPDHLKSVLAKHIA